MGEVGYIMIDLEKIKSIKGRLNATTPGKWIAHDVPYTEDVAEAPSVYTEQGMFICAATYDNLSHTTDHNVTEDTIFIANAKEDIEFLLQTVEFLLSAPKHKI